MLLKDLICVTATCKPSLYNVVALLDDRLTDVTVTVSLHGEVVQSYKLHRIILAGCSSFLHDALVNNENENECQTYDITCMSPSEFELAIKYMYTGDMCFHSVEELCLGLYAASVFNFEDLSKECLKRLRNKIMEDYGNAVKCSQLDERFNILGENGDLLIFVDDIIKKHYATILKSPVIEDFHSDTMRRLVQMNAIEEIPEIEIFRALLKWSKSCCIKKKVDSEDPKELQAAADYLIYFIQYNLIEHEMLQKEVIPSGLIPDNLKDHIYEIKELNYTKSIHDHSTVKSNPGSNFNLSLDQQNVRSSQPHLMNVLECFQNKMHMISTCTSEQHSVNEYLQCHVEVDFPWDGIGWLTGNSGWLYLPRNLLGTQWQVRFSCWMYGNFGLWLRCKSLNKKFNAVIFRLFAQMNHLPLVWLEAAGIVQSSQEWIWCTFPVKLSQLPPTKSRSVLVRVHWTEVEIGSPENLHLQNNEQRIKCRWQLHGWKSVCVTTDYGWSLFSEPFGFPGALWRFVVTNKPHGTQRKFKFAVQLQFLAAALINRRYLLTYTLFLCDHQLEDLKIEMKKGSTALWSDDNKFSLECQDPLDVTVIINTNLLK